MFGAPDPRRELETVAAEIWSLRAARRARCASTTSRSSFPRRRRRRTCRSPARCSRRRPSCPTPCSTCRRPPRATSWRRSSCCSRLPSGPLGRRELLQLAMHPTVARRFPDVDPEAFLALCEQLGIVRGADGGDLADSYARRGSGELGPGAASGWRWGRSCRGGAAARSGRSRSTGEAMLAAELPAAREPAARALGDDRARADRLRAHGAGADRAGRAVHGAAPAHARRDHPPGQRPRSRRRWATASRCWSGSRRPRRPISRSATASRPSWCARACGTAQRRPRAPEGVAVATFAPLRALPFRIVFVLGLDERVFPSPAGFGALDLRAAAPQPGDVTPREQDEYVFLETLLSARERLDLSYVGRDAETGERKDPSSTLLALRDVLGRGRTAKSCSSTSRADPPLARHRDDAVCAVMPAAARERQAARSASRCARRRASIQLPEASALRAALPAAAWAAIAPPLGQLGLGAKTDAPRRAGHHADARRSAPLSRMPAAGIGARAAADARRRRRGRRGRGGAARSREPGRRARPDVALAARSVRARDRRRRERRRRAGRALRRRDRGPAARRHAARRRVRQGRCAPATSACCARGAKASARRCAGSLPTGLARIWYGAAPEHRRDVKIDPAIPLSVPLPEGPRDVALYGQTEALALVGGERMAVTLVIGTRAIPRTRSAGRLADAPGARRVGPRRRSPARDSGAGRHDGRRAGGSGAEAGSRRSGRTTRARCSPGSPPSCSPTCTRTCSPARASSPGSDASGRVRR